MALRSALLFLIVILCSANVLSQTITSFTPISGPVGTSIIITGTGFNTTTTNNIVFFGATSATVSEATSTSLTVTVPVGASSAPITALDATTGLLAYSPSKFTPTFAPNKGSIASTDFDPKVDFGTGVTPNGVAIGDLDGDGKADLAVVNLNSNTVSIFRNTSSIGTISYAAKVDFATGSTPRFVAIGDLDGDGKPDLVTANNGDNTVSILRNTSSIGTLNFDTRVDFGAGSSTWSVSIGDLDEDGKADLVIGKTSFNQAISVLHNTSSIGIISYAAAVDFNVGPDVFTDPLTIVIGDLDGDGMADLATLNSNSGLVSVLRNTSSSGIISFASYIEFAARSLTVALAIGDLDGDGKADLAGSSVGSNTISVFRNTGSSGSISFAAKVDFATSASPQSIAMADMDGDGKLELVVANQGSSTVSILRNTGSIGTISYAPRVDITAGLQSYSVSIGDLDGDGKPDLATANQNANTVSVIRNNPFAPTITGFTPTSAAAGATVTITGTNFTGATAVSFGGTSATSFNIISGTSITAVLSTGASGSVSVTNSDGTRTLAGFTFIPAPTITSFTPTSAGSAASVVITGTNFIGATVVSFGGTSATSFTVNSATQITAVVANGTSGSVSVTTPGGTGTRSGFTFGPLITSFTPVDAGLGKTITITGENFTGATSVTFGGTVATSFTVISSTSISAVVGAGSSGNVTVTTPFGPGSKSGFTWYPVPTVTFLTPSGAGTGTTIQINGGNFFNVTEVTFGGTPAASYIVAGDSRIYAVVARGTSGVVRVSTPGGSAIRAGFAYIRTQIPTVTSFTPTTLPIIHNGETIRITGTNFLDVSSVRFAGTEATSYNVISSTQIDAVVPALSVGTYQITVTTPDGPGNLGGFRIAPIPTITSFTPVNAGSGTTVTISGTGFTGATDLSFGGTPATSFLVVSATQITAVVDAGASGDVSVTTLGGTGTLAGFIFISAPTITSFTPTSAARAASVVITGTNFTGATAVSFGGTAATSFTVNSSTQITAVVASGTSGSISVITPGGTGTRTGFTFIPAPTITSFTPTSAASAASVVITGTNFTGATVVSFGGTAATSFTVNSATQITAVVASGTSGNISVTTSGGTGTFTGFTFIPAPTITSFIPTASSSGATVTITGTSFTDVSDVNFGGTAASSFTVVSPTTIEAIVADGLSGSVSVTTPGGIITIPGFIFIPSPTISSFTSSATDGVSVVITGTNFNNASAVSFGGTAATAFTVTSSTQITAIVGGGTSGSVSVTTPGGTATKTGFTFIPVPTISSFTPTHAGSGTAIVIKGTNFDNTSAVSFGGTAATAFVVNSSTQITAVIATGASGRVSLTTPVGTASLDGFIFDEPLPLVKEGTDALGTVVANSQSSSVDAGATPQFNDLLKEFIIENSGTAALTVNSITSSSSKFAIQQSPTAIQPGTFGLLVVRLDALELGVFSTRINIQFDLGTYQFNVTGEVISEEIEVYNVVTPNGDGVHDFLKIKNIEYHESNVYVFDRWGDKVFEVENYDNTNPLKRFEGTSNIGNPKDLNDGTYFYVIDTTGKKKKTGFIQLSR